MHLRPEVLSPPPSALPKPWQARMRPCTAKAFRSEPSSPASPTFWIEDALLITMMALVRDPPWRQSRPSFNAAIATIEANSSPSLSHQATENRTLLEIACESPCGLTVLASSVQHAASCVDRLIKQKPEPVASVPGGPPCKPRWEPPKPPLLAALDALPAAAGLFLRCNGFT
jgi:hypothetical protein